jgi:hypothetical protein
MNYTTAKEKLGTRDSRKLCNNTYLQRRADGTIAVKLHATDVLIFRPDDSVEYQTGGWHTVTTKERMNNYGADGRWIWQDKGIWTIGTRDKRVLYKDGVVITKRGRIIGGGSPSEGKAQLKLKKQIDKYCKGFAADMMAGKIPAPSNGDCLYCHMVVVKDGRPLGDATGDQSHILSHIKEKYFVPSLLVNAINADLGTISIIGKQMVGEIWSRKAVGNSQAHPLLEGDNGMKGFVEKQVMKTLRKYIKQRLGLVI